VREETGLEALELGPELGSIDWFFRQNEQLIHKFCSFFLIRSATGEVIPEVAEGITECLWLPIDEAMERITYENAREMIRAAARLLEGTEAPGPGAF
jgi:8-oxo-dGTP pyrophosphatase MutT (NUDIX family)